jgi:hypothetical protein
MGFHEVPWNSMRFYDVLVNRSVPTEANRGLTSYTYSPDLNSIEHLWWHLKKRMHKFYPQYNNYSVAEEEWEGFCEALKECWQRIPSSLIKHLIMSMPQRMAACRKAHGWQTKY